jgi:hypothetical protein
MSEVLARLIGGSHDGQFYYIREDKEYLELSFNENQDVVPWLPSRSQDKDMAKSAKLKVELYRRKDFNLLGIKDYALFFIAGYNPDVLLQKLFDQALKTVKVETL